ncbi:hypothetical protein BDZ94DRAFT_1228892 [Collybia nuda]|uniref:Uncharacterized protein n=1 Tax=Collybia nuda TaxID=64659 RepID=A0A9P6CD84_9AGAR|nr:hypothetical protein BDZ94DRAFT_1228892 [Collybia nuda]
MFTLTISEKDFLNSEIIPNGPGYCSFTTQTKTGFRGLKKTVLQPTVQHRAAAPIVDGSIDWRGKTFEIGGKVKNWKVLKHRQGSIFDWHPVREWTWMGHRYTVKREDNQWMATIHASVSAVFTSRKSHVLSQSEPATIEFTSNVPHEDMVFLLLVLLWSEHKRLEKKSQTTDAMSEGISAANSL